MFSDWYLVVVIFLGINDLEEELKLKLFFVLFLKIFDYFLKDFFYKLRDKMIEIDV